MVVVGCSRYVTLSMLHHLEKSCDRTVATFSLGWGPGWKTFVPAGAMPTVETVQKVDALRTVLGLACGIWTTLWLCEHLMSLIVGQTNFLVKIEAYLAIHAIRRFPPNQWKNMKNKHVRVWQCWLQTLRTIWPQNFITSSDWGRPKPCFWPDPVRCRRCD